MRCSCKFVSLMYWEELQIIISFKDLELERKSSNIFTVKDMNPIEIESIIMCIYSSSSILFALNKRSTKALLSSATKGYIITIGLKAECFLPMAHGIRLHRNTLSTDHYHYTYVRRVLFLSNYLTEDHTLRRSKKRIASVQRNELGFPSGLRYVGMNKHLIPFSSLPPKHIM